MEKRKKGRVCACVGQFEAREGDGNVVGSLQIQELHHLGTRKPCQYQTSRRPVPVFVPDSRAGRYQTSRRTRHRVGQYPCQYQPSRSRYLRQYQTLSKNRYYLRLLASALGTSPGLFPGLCLVLAKDNTNNHQGRSGKIRSAISKVGKDKCSVMSSR
eukprot:694556-Rhodomonas_salina.2